jgi:hypothetical protein
MTGITALKGTDVLIKIEDPANPGVFTHSCMINLARTVKFTASMVSDVLQNCDAPDEPGTVYAFKDSIKFDITGAGKLDTMSLDFWMDFFESKDARNAKVVFNATGANGGQTTTCQLHCTDFEPASSAEPHKYAEAAVTLTSHGAWSRAANA